MAENSCVNRTEDTITIPVGNFIVLVSANTRLECVKKIILADPCEYGHLDKTTENAVNILLGIERKEKAD